MERGSRTVAPRARRRLGWAWVIAAGIIATIIVVGFALRAVA